MKLQNINRNYGSSFKFFYDNKGNVEEYEKFVKNNEPEKVKNITVPYYEESLHIIYSYSTMFKWFIPILTLMFCFIIKTYSLLPIIMISYLIVLYLRKRWKVICMRYLFEMVAIDYFINQKFHTNCITNLDELGEKYLQKFIK
jgi:hypothetical protein